MVSNKRKIITETNINTMENSKSKRKNNITTIAGVVVGLIVFYLVKQFVFTTPSFDESMMKVASTLNESCPIMVDQETRLDNVMALPENVFQYNYTLINYVKDSINVDVFKQNLQPQIFNTVKTNPDMKIYRDNKTTIAYSYKDKNGVFITKISVTSDQYTDVN